MATMSGILRPFSLVLVETVGFVFQLYPQSFPSPRLNEAAVDMDAPPVHMLT